MATTVLLADDHALLRQGLRRILESYPGLEVVAEASTGTQAVEMALQYEPDVALLDVAMPELNGLEATARILKRVPRTAVLILSMYNDARYVSRALKAGARGYLLKDSVEQDLVEAIELARQGKSFFSPAVAKLMEAQRAAGAARDIDDRYELLTERERQIYQLLAEGKSNKDIANLFNLSLHTVETHRTRIMEKLDVHSSAELVLSAVRRGLVR